MMIIALWILISFAIAVAGMVVADKAKTTRLSILGQTVAGLALESLLVSLLFGAVIEVFARDRDGRYANSALKPWFDSLKSGKGLCCSDADGSALSDSDWDVKDGHYRVRVPQSTIPGGNNESIWVDVPDDAVITEPNRAGRTMVWPIYGYMGVSIRCFIPGSMI